jgi:AraC-like DNA-binding protein
MLLEQIEINTAQLDGLTSIHGRPGIMAREHRHQEIELNFLTRGSMTYLFSGAPRVVPEGRLAVFWAIFPHQVIRIDGDPLFHCVYFPLARLLQWALPGDLSAAILNGQLVVDASPDNDPIDRALMPRWRRDIEEGLADNGRAIYLEIEARLRRLAFAPPEIAPTRPQPGRPAPHHAAHDPAGLGKLERMTAYIAANYTEPLGIGDVARHVDLHPKYVMALFRKSFGMTIVDYVTQHRVSHAQRLLATTDLKVADIGYEAGFGSMSRFYEAFERASGQTPLAFRRSVRG